MSDTNGSILDQTDQNENALYALFFVTIALFLGENRAETMLHVHLEACILHII